MSAGQRVVDALLALQRAIKEVGGDLKVVGVADTRPVEHVLRPGLSHLAVMPNTSAPRGTAATVAGVHIMEIAWAVAGAPAEADESGPLYIKVLHAIEKITPDVLSRVRDKAANTQDGAIIRGSLVSHDGRRFLVSIRVGQPPISWPLVR
jgi:hypothetical protein